MAGTVTLNISSCDSVVTYKWQKPSGFFCFVVFTGSKLGRSGGTGTKQQLHCGAAGCHILGAGASEELQGLPSLQYQSE